jgi:hypothetical protein
MSVKESYGSFHKIKITNIIDILKYRGGNADFSKYKDEFINGDERLEICCMMGHKWTTIAERVAEWCTLCNILSQLRKIDPLITTRHTEFDISRISFDFNCSKNHTFVTDIKRAKRGCLCCDALNKARKKHCVNDSVLTLDAKSVYHNDHCRLRFHCNKLRHNPFCQNLICKAIRERVLATGHSYDPKCTNFVPCNQDFYMTPKILMCDFIYSCERDHVWIKGWESINAIRMFELYYDTKFDDIDLDGGPEFTGYNKKLGIAFIHLADTRLAKQGDKVLEYCIANKIMLIEIPPEITQSSRMATFIFTSLCQLGQLKEKKENVINDVRTKMRLMSVNHKILEDRIE